jgi:hypothetical protein
MYLLNHLRSRSPSTALKDGIYLKTYVGPGWVGPAAAAFIKVKKMPFLIKWSYNLIYKVSNISHEYLTAIVGR